MAVEVPTLVWLGTLLATSAAAAAPCDPSATVSGDPGLVSEVGELLARHGISNEGDGCPMVHARLEHRGAEIVVIREGEPPAERLVAEPATAATVIESWSRSDFENPLLASHPIVVASAPELAPAVRSDAVTTTAPYVPHHGVQLFGAMETSFADDKTSWLGAVVGVCVQLGRVCGSARGRFAAVANGPGRWDDADRHASDVLFGGDVPFRLGSTMLSLGFGAGMGAVHTGTRMSGVPSGTETFGLRADAHLAWIIPLGHRLAVDLSASFDVSQVTDVEGSSGPSIADEPRIFGRLGAGLRVGGP